MSHYADGTKAQIGDQVVGKLYSTDGIVAGTIVSITPNADSCNAMVQYTRVLPVDAVTVDGLAHWKATGCKPLMAVEWSENGSTPVHRVKKTRNHQSDGDEVALVVCADYCQINQLTKVGP